MIHVLSVSEIVRPKGCWSVTTHEKQSQPRTHRAIVEYADEPVDVDYTVMQVPRSACKPFVSLANVLLAFTISTTTMLIGAALGNSVHDLDADRVTTDVARSIGDPQCVTITQPDP